MNKYRVMLTSSISLMVGGALLSVYGIFSEKIGITYGVLAAAIGLLLLGAWISKAYIFICKKCYLRIDIGVKEALTALPSGGGCRRIYCSKCRKKTRCKARRIPLKVHVF